MQAAGQPGHRHSNSNSIAEGTPKLTVIITPAAREAVALALEAAVRLARETGLPLNLESGNPLDVTIMTGTDETRIEEIGRIAGILRDHGYEPLPVGPGATRRLYGVSARIGTGVVYKAVAVVSPSRSTPVLAVAAAA